MIFNEVDPEVLTGTFWFQQDGAPPHFSINVAENFHEIFGERLNG